MVMKCSTSGWAMSMVSISAPRRPFCATSRVVLLKRSMKLTAPVLVRAALLTAAPSGRRLLRSKPTPQRRLKSWANCWSLRKMPP
jgi:hypothetical protein